MNNAKTIQSKVNFLGKINVKRKSFKVTISALALAAASLFSGHIYGYAQQNVTTDNHVKSSIVTTVSSEKQPSKQVKRAPLTQEQIDNLFIQNQTHLESLTAYTDILKTEYVKYMSNNSASERTPVDFYHSFYRSYPYMIDIIEDGDYIKLADRVANTLQPTGDTNHFAFTSQVNLANNKKEHFKDVLQFINKNGNPKYSALFNDYDLPNKTTK